MDQGVIFLDLKKAFDSIDHNILLMKMKLYGITQHSLKWFRSCLTSRIQVCKVDHVQSKQISMKYGVPQGSTLGLLFFLVVLIIHQIALHVSPQVRCINQRQISNRS